MAIKISPRLTSALAQDMNQTAIITLSIVKKCCSKIPLMNDKLQCTTALAEQSFNAKFTTAFNHVFQTNNAIRHLRFIAEISIIMHDILRYVATQATYELGEFEHGFQLILRIVHI